MKIILKNTRLAFAKIWEPEQFNGTGEPACNASFLMDPKSPNLKTLQAAIQQVATEKWKDKAAAVIKQLQAKGDICLHSGDEKAEYDGFEGMMFVSARNKSRPVVIDRNKTPLTQADGKPYSGCFVNVSLDVWAQDNKFGKRINAKLLAIQFWEDGEAFSGGEGYADDDFGDAEEATEGADGFFG